MKLLGPSGIGSLIEISDYNDFILYSEEDLNRWGLPGKELISECEKIKVDVYAQPWARGRPESPPTPGCISRASDGHLKRGG